MDEKDKEEAKGDTHEDAPVASFFEKQKAWMRRQGKGGKGAKQGKGHRTAWDKGKGKGKTQNKDRGEAKAKGKGRKGGKKGQGRSQDRE